MDTRRSTARSILNHLGVVNIESFAPVPGGFDTEIWQVEHDGLISALRIFRPEQVLGAKIEEAALLVAPGAVPIPVTRKRAEWQGQSVALTVWLPGDPMADVISANPTQARYYGLLLGHAQAAIHQLPAPAALLNNRDTWVYHMESLIPAHQPGDCLLHCDFHPRNVLVQEGVISGVIDWLNASAGDPRLDYARTRAIFETVDPPSFGFDEMTWQEIAHGWREGYAEIAGEPRDIDHFMPWALQTCYADQAKNRAHKPEAGTS